MKIRTIKLTSKQFTEVFQGKTFVSNLPADAELLDVKFDLATRQLSAIVRSEGFDEVADAYPIPEFSLVFYAKPQPAIQPAPQPKPEAKPAVTVTVKTESAPAKKAQPTSPVSRVENEFSPDQRKLLTFKVEGDHVVVKPATFLKEEWQDINEVVRGCGGRWVKGDIISYWEIPLQ